MPSLFAYGSLMYPEVAGIILGRSVDSHHLVDAMVKNYRRIAIPGRPYPTGIAAPIHQIHGKLLLGLSKSDLKRLDAYEESFYIRKRVTVEIADGLRNAFLYVDSRNPLPFPIQEWDAEKFEREHLPAFVKSLGTRWKAEDRLQ